jgi:CBS-domain-containing membrane protein
VEAVGMTQESKHMTVLESTDSFVKLLELFSFAHTHRVLVKDSSNQYVMLSQMDILRFLQANNHKLGSAVLDITVPDIHQHHHTLVRTSYKSTAAECFLKLVQNLTQSALPILDDDQDEFIGEVSARDLRGITKDRWDTLQKPIVMYLKESQGDLHLPFTCKDHFTLSQIMTSCVLRETYRLWWLDQNDTLKGVISITDILVTILGIATNPSK